jgi:hypothetical protein
VQQKLGRNFGNITSVTTAQVQKSNADKVEAQKQKVRSQQFANNEKAIFRLLEEIAAIELDLLKAGYDSDKKIEALVQSGRVSSAEYQKAILLLQRKGDLGIARQASLYQLGENKLNHKASQDLEFDQHKHTLDINAINASYAQKKALATQGQTTRIAQSNQRQLEMAAFRREVKALPGGYSSNQGQLGGGSGGYSGLNAGGGGGGNSLWSGFKKMIGWS